MAQQTFSGVPGDSKCECADWNCPAHKGHSDCREVATSILYRVDMQDETGTAFCDACADDAMESGLFTDSLNDDSDVDVDVDVDDDSTDRPNGYPFGTIGAETR